MHDVTNASGMMDVSDKRGEMQHLVLAHFSTLFLLDISDGYTKVVIKTRRTCEPRGISWLLFVMTANLANWQPASLTWHSNSNSESKDVSQFMENPKMRTHLSIAYSDVKIQPTFHHDKSYNRTNCRFVNRAPDAFKCSHLSVRVGAYQIMSWSVAILYHQTIRSHFE